MRKIMSVLDVGHNTIKLVVGESTKNKFNLLATSEIKTLGYNKFEITSEEEFTNSIKAAFDEASEKLGITLNKTIVIVPSLTAEYIVGEATIKIGGETPTVKPTNIARVLLESTSGIVQDNMELVNTIPMYFTLDDNTKTLNPKGALSKSLSVKSVIATATKSSVYKILTILDKLNIDIVDISFAPIGDYYNVKCSKYDKTTGAIINLGHYNTIISIFTKGILTNSTIVELGGRNIENDLSYIYKTSRDTSKYIKEHYAYASPKFASKNDFVEVLNKDNNKISINQLEASEIIESRLLEILKEAKKQISELTKKNINYIVITGGLSEILDLNLLVEKVFEDKAEIMSINEIGVRNNKYSSALGLIKWYNSMQELKGKDYSIFTIEEQEEFSGIDKLGNNTDNTIIGKVFGYFFDN